MSQDSPLYLHSQSAQNARLHTLNAPALKFNEKLCEDCNTSRTQPFDRAWEKLSKALRDEEASIVESGGFDLRALFGKTADTDTLNLHLFFVKLTLGQIVMSGSQIDREPFRRALLDSRELQSLYLKFFFYREEHETLFAGQTDLQEWRVSKTGEPVGLAWAYMPGSHIEPQILWSATHEEFLGAWRPGLGSSWVAVHLALFDG